MPSPSSTGLPAPRVPPARCTLAHGTTTVLNYPTPFRLHLGEHLSESLWCDVHPPAPLHQALTEVRVLVNSELEDSAYQAQFPSQVRELGAPSHGF